MSSSSLPSRFAEIAHGLRILAAHEGHDLPGQSHPADEMEVCLHVAEAQRSEMRTLRGLAEKGVNHVTTYLKTSGFPIKPASGTQLFLNILFHVFILMVALTVLYLFNVAPLEHKSLQNEVGSKMDEAIGNAFQSTTKAQRCQLAAMAPALAQLSELYAGEDPLRKKSNALVMTWAYGIIAVLGFVFITGIAVLLLAGGVNMGRSVAEIIFENLIIFAIVGAAEYIFFKLVSVKYIPIMPSELGKDAVSALKATFKK